MHYANNAEIISIYDICFEGMDDAGFHLLELHERNIFTNILYFAILSSSFSNA